MNLKKRKKKELTRLHLKNEVRDAQDTRHKRKNEDDNELCIFGIRLEFQKWRNEIVTRKRAFNLIQIHLSIVEFFLFL